VTKVARGAWFLAAALLPAPSAVRADDPTVLAIADFAKDLDGFGGAMTRDPSGSQAGAACARLDNHDKPWVEASKSLTGLAHDFTELRFWARSAEVKTVTMRLADAVGHNYQQRFPLTPDGQWHPFVVTRFDRGQAWGGPAGGGWVGPPRSITFVLEAKGTLWLNGLEATLDPRRPLAPFAIRSRVLGNVFLEGQPVEIPIETQASRLEYEVTDYFGAKVCAGSAIVTDGMAVLKPEVAGRGQFVATVHLIGVPGGPREVDFAVLEPIDPARLADSPFGVMTHFAQGWDPAIIPLIARAGLLRVRDEAYWAQVEKRAGVFDCTPFDRYLAALKAAGIRPLVPLTFANPLYDEGQTPYTTAGRAAYARYGEELLKHYGDQLDAVEVWNEYNGTWCQGPAAADRPKFYAEMLAATYPRLKALRPAVTVLGSGVVTIPLPYLEDLFKHGALANLDAVVIHPYRGRPEGVEREIADLRALIRRYNDGQDKPIWATEYGYGEADPRQPTVPRLLVRQSVLMLSQSVARMYWYLLRDYNEFKGMGLLHDPADPRGAYSPAPAYAAMAAMVRLLHDARFVAREPAGPYSRTYLMRFRKGDQDVRACWAGQPGQIRVRGAAGLTRVDLMGNARPVALADGAATLDVDETPFYLLGPAEVSEVPTALTVVADATADFSTKAQGENGWFYGYFDGSAKPDYAPAAFQPFAVTVTPWGERWAGPMPFLSASAGSLHPQIKYAKAVWAIKRWRSPLAGEVVVRGHFDRDRQGDGCLVMVLVDGVKRFEELAGGPREPTRRAFELTTAAQVGTLIEFAVAPAPGGKLDFDNTEIDAQVLLRR